MRLVLRSTRTHPMHGRAAERGTGDRLIRMPDDATNTLYLIYYFIIGAIFLHIFSSPPLSFSLLVLSPYGDLCIPDSVHMNLRRRARSITFFF